MTSETDATLKPGNDNDILYVPNASAEWLFVEDNGEFAPPSGVPWTLEHDATNHEYTLTDETTNQVLVFYDFDASVNLNQRGKLKEKTTVAWQAAGKTGHTYTYFTTGSVDEQGRPKQITTAEGQDYTIVFNYNENIVDLVESVEVKDGANTLMKVEYTYYDDVDDENATDPKSTYLGISRNLVQTKVSRRATDTSYWIERFTQYRYYPSGDPSAGRLKHVYKSDAIQRILNYDDTLTDPDDILLKDDAYKKQGSTWTIQEFASRVFDYYTDDTSTSSITTDWESNENLNSRYGGGELAEKGFVKEERIGGVACCGGSTSAVTREYYYMDENATGVNQTDRIVVEDTIDADGDERFRTIYGLDTSARMLREAVTDDPIASTGKYWCKSWTFVDDPNKPNKTLRLAERRERSAHDVSNTTIDEFLHPQDGNNDSTTLRDTEGVIYVYTYNDEGNRTGTKVKKGENGTEHYVSAKDYEEGTNPVRMHLVKARYDYTTKTTSRTAANITNYTYTYWDGTDSIKTRTTTLPGIPGSQNGPGSDENATIVEYFDLAGRLRWSVDPEGYIDYFSYDPETGERSYIVTDVDPSSVPGSGGSTGNWLAQTADNTDDNGTTYNEPSSRDSGLPTALALVTKHYFDDQGRLERTVDRGGSEHYTIYESDRVMQFLYWDDSGQEPALPVRVRALDGGGTLVEEYDVDPAKAEKHQGKPRLVSTTSSSDYVRWTKYSYHGLHGQLESVERYHDISQNTFDEVKYLYDSLGRRGATIVEFETDKFQVDVELFDVLGRVTETRSGVATTEPTDYDDLDDYDSMEPTEPEVPTGFSGYAIIAQTEYDEGDVGDGHVTKIKTYYDTDKYTGQEFRRTFRGHLRGVEPVYDDGTGEDDDQGPYIVYDIDWKGRTTATGQYDDNSGFGTDWATVLTSDGYTNYADSTATDRRTLAKSYYDDVGRMYRTEEYAIDENGTKGDYSQTNNYYDLKDQLVASGVEHDAATEFAYDGANRQYQTRVVRELNSTLYTDGKFQYREPEPDPHYSSSDTTAMSGGNETMIQMVHQVLDDSGNVTEVHTFEMNHNDSNGLKLVTDGYVRSSVYTWYDDADRTKTVANLGSGDTASGAGVWKYTTIPSRGTEPTASSDQKLVTKYEYYADSGRLKTMTDPTGKEITTTYDDLGRRTSVVDDDTGNDEQEAQWKYNGLGNVTELKALNTSTGDQVTTYTFGDSINASWATEVSYPDADPNDPDDVVTMAYHTDGTLEEKTDQRGTVMDYTYDTRRQLELEDVTTLGDTGHNVDGTVRSIKREYDDIGRLEKISSRDENGTVLNQVQYEYGDVGKITKAWQEHDDEVTASGGSESLKVVYEYDLAESSGVFRNGTRLKSVTYPSGRKVQYAFDSSSAFYDRLHRPRATKVTYPGGSSLVEVVEYRYNGLNRVVSAEYRPGASDPDVKLDYYQGTSGEYKGFDRFGRIVDQFWDDTGSSSDPDRFKYGHDYAGNPEWREDVIADTNDHDTFYTYDGLHRLTKSDRGDLTGSPPTGVTDSNRLYKWALDETGNWTDFNATILGSLQLDQDREHSKANEISDITNDTGNAWIDPDYDEAGNMTEGPNPGDGTTKQQYKYDAWNRIVEVLDDENATVATYEYDGLNRRIEKVDKRGMSDVTYHYYYNRDWQVLEVRKDGVTDPVEQYVWHLYYIDALALRLWDGDEDGDIEAAEDEIQYFTFDANFNITALLNDSGTVKERYGYTPYGTLSIMDASFSNRSSSDYEIPYAYTGRRFDEESELYYYRNRYYDPLLGRFVTRDPIGYEDAPNLYVYALCQPVGYVDPSGLKTLSQLPPNPSPPIDSPTRPWPGRPGPTRPWPGTPYPTRPGPGTGRPGPTRPWPGRPGPTRPWPGRPGPTRPWPGTPNPTRPVPGPIFRCLKWICRHGNPIAIVLLSPKPCGRGSEIIPYCGPLQDCKEEEDCDCICFGEDDVGKRHGPHTVGKMTEWACKNYPNTDDGRWREFTDCKCRD